MMVLTKSEVFVNNERETAWPGGAPIFQNPKNRGRYPFSRSKVKFSQPQRVGSSFITSLGNFERREAVTGDAPEIAVLGEDAEHTFGVYVPGAIIQSGSFRGIVFIDDIIPEGAGEFTHPATAI